ncbi:hypothetical protein BC830DRAFT_466362 [Chytriomyces sp. MP71]|nr:hypothetical protein BC830DRAFT_466362 [Chytriomyces sp. MP71]
MLLEVLLRPGTIAPLAPLQTLEREAPDAPGPSGGSGTNANANPFAAITTAFAKTQDTLKSTVFSAVGGSNPAILASLPASSSSAASVSASQTQAPTATFVESIELFDNTLIVGTTDGQVLSYAISLAENPNDAAVSLQLTLAFKRIAASGRKPVDAVVALVAEAKLLVFSDNTLSFHSLRSLAPISAASPSFKSLSAICVDKTLDPPFNFCIAKRRSVQIYQLSDNAVTPTKEYPLQDGAITIKKSGRTILAADAHTYKLINESNGRVTPLFPYDRSLMRPIICQVGDNEFLLAFATAQMIGLGMFVNSAGDAVRGTLEWPVLPKSIVFQFPNIIALLRNNTILVHNLFSQELVTTLHVPPEFIEPRSLSVTAFPLYLHPAAGTGEAKRVVKVLVACREAVLMLVAKGIDEQILDLLETKQVSKALQLAENAIQWNETDNTKKEVFDRIYERAGLAFFEDLNFDDALKCFKKGEVDPFMLLSRLGGLVPGLGIDESAFMDVDVLFADTVRKANSELEEDAIGARVATARAAGKDMLTSYLLFARSKDYAVDHLEDIDNYLLCVYESSGYAELNAFLSLPNHLDISRTERFLQQKQRHYALSLLYKATQQTKKVLDIWLRFVSGEYEDPEFEGPAAVAGFVAGVTDRNMFEEFLKKVLMVDPSLGVQVLKQTSIPFDLDSVVSLLADSENAALIEYLEYVHEHQTKADPACNTRLLALYLQELESVYDAAGAIKIRNLYLKSDPPRVPFLEFLGSATDAQSRLRARILGLLDESATPATAESEALKMLLERSGLFLEHARARAACGEHARALRVWVCDLGDYGAAEGYCCAVGDAAEAAEDVFSDLLRLYLRPDTDLQTRTHEFPNQALHLLNSYPDRFMMSEVIELLPNRWSLAALKSFVTWHLRFSARAAHEGLLVKSLVRGENLRTNAELAMLYELLEPAIVRPETRCRGCGRAIDAGSDFALVANGEVVHVSCLSIGTVE